MKTLPLNMLRAYAAVFETGGIRPAARLLDVTHSSVSRFVSELEAWLGTPLIDRRQGRRLVAFTPEGEALGRATLQSLSGLETALNAIREQHNANSVVIETTPSFAARWLLPRLGHFEQAFKRIELSVLVDQRLRTGSQSGVDFSMRMGKGPWPGTDAFPFMNDALYPVAAPRYWNARCGPDPIDSLIRCRLLHDRDPNSAWALWRKRFGPAQLTVREGPRFSSSDLVLKAAEQGLGVALARHRFVTDQLAAGSLMAPFGEARIDLPRAHWIVMPEGGVRKSVALDVIEWLKAQALLQRVGRTIVD